ncbi:TolC family protein [Photobacterium sp. ZSDE20]|uniref:TolC family protein n=1 Tax=Photobacterium pectinilyticum TaxID=2906793 RepID=A0ABT1N2H7_9GAMM|nr:TolC family protein [Photobacterium sp. ZSDE20]MCQ1058742.1 TolC family protein [Photobacterium sp. ZSDE20]MDD1823524.1 TolC family protein [Photobacterium sp. ZSDE20]
MVDEAVLGGLSVVSKISVCITVLSLLVTSGCTVLGPKFEGVAPATLPTSWSTSDLEQSKNKTARWWQQFDDPVLNELVEKASQQNLDLEAAGLRILQARTAVGVAESFQYPQRQNVSGSVAKIYQNENTFDNASLSFDAAWELDVWGRYALGVESAEATLYASIASYHDILVTITSEVARNYINYRTFQERVLLSERNIEIQRRVERITEIQYESGDVTELDVQQARTQLYNTESALPSLKIGMMQSRNAIAVLLGILPDQVMVLLDSPWVDAKVKVFDNKYEGTRNSRLTSDYDQYSLIPATLPISTQVDAGLVLRRPDLQLAELQAHAQNSQIGIAEADLYPQFSLFGVIGLNSTVPAGNDFSFSDSLNLSLGPAFSWNIFQYGRVKNAIRAQDARFQETLTNYNKQVLLAVQEVTNALESYQLNQYQQKLAFRSVDASVRAYNISLTQYENGQISFERLLNSLEKMTRSEDAYAIVKGNVANQVVALYKSLGGGWEAETGRPYLNDALRSQMENRTDWGEMLDETQLPLLSPDQVPNAVSPFGEPIDPAKQSYPGGP